MSAISSHHHGKLYPGIDSRASKCNVNCTEIAIYSEISGYRKSGLTWTFRVHFAQLSTRSNRIFTLVSCTFDVLTSNSIHARPCFILLFSQVFDKISAIGGQLRAISPNVQ